MPIYNMTVIVNVFSSYFKEEIAAETLAMMSKISQTDMITNVERASLVRGNYKQDAGERSAFAQMLEQEESKLRQQRINGLNEAGKKESIDHRMDGKVQVYNNHGVLNYFQVMISMTDLKG